MIMTRRKIKGIEEELRIIKEKWNKAKWTRYVTDNGGSLEMNDWKKWIEITWKKDEENKKKVDRLFRC